MISKLPKRERQRLRKLVIIVLVILVIPLIILFANWLELVEQYGAWLWVLLLIPIGGLIFLAVRYQRLRQILFTGYQEVSDLLEEPTGKKPPRTPIPAEKVDRVYRRAGSTCEWESGGRRCREPIQEIHHIDENRTNHSMSNLIALCGTHHNKVRSVSKALLRSWARQHNINGLKKKRG